MKIKKERRNMMMKNPERKVSSFTVDMTKLDDNGSFQCPKCGIPISPDDETGDSYEILETKLVNEELEELVISCAKCGSTIKVTGFQEGLVD